MTDNDTAAVLPPNEAARLAAVRRYEILDTPPDGAFDRIAVLAAAFCNVPIATVTIVDHDRIWFKAAHGIEVDQIDRDPGLCASAILQDDPYIVTDAIKDPRCFENPLVRGELGVRFYAAAPIRTQDGYNLGTVNVIAGQPREITATEIGVLRHLADVIADELEFRMNARRTVESERVQRHRAEHLIDVLQSRLLPQRQVEVPRLDVATYYRSLSTELAIGGDFVDVFDVDECSWALVVGDVCGKGPYAAAATGEIRAALRAIARIQTDPRRMLATVNDALCRDGLQAAPGQGSEELFCTVGVVQMVDEGSHVRVTAASAGHPLALVRRGDGTVEPLGNPGQLLGAFPEIEVGEATAELVAGDMVLLYTDGAVEQRGMSIAVGERALTAALEAAPTGSAQVALAHVRDAVESLHESFNDDVALVLARITE